MKAEKMQSNLVENKKKILEVIEKTRPEASNRVNAIKNKSNLG